MATTEILGLPWTIDGNNLVMAGEEVTYMSDLAPAKATYEQAQEILRLVAAAPAMLEALTALLDAPHCHPIGAYSEPSKDYDARQKATRERAQAAIAKATR